MEWTEVPSAFEMDSMCTILSFWFSPFIILFKVLAGMCVSFDKVAWVIPFKFISAISFSFLTVSPRFLVIPYFIYIKPRYKHQIPFMDNSTI